MVGRFHFEKLSAGKSAKPEYLVRLIRFSSCWQICHLHVTKMRTLQLEMRTYRGPPGNVYCRVPQDAPFNVRGARNIPCETKARQARTDRRDVQKRRELRPAQRRLPLEGDPNATTSGQAIPQLPPGTPGSTALPPAPLAVAEYDPATGTYVGADGKTYTQANLARDANQHQTWQDMLSPPKGHRPLLTLLWCN